MVMAVGPSWVALLVLCGVVDGNAGALVGEVLGAPPGNVGGVDEVVPDHAAT
jgi:hypothetical protein